MLIVALGVLSACATTPAAPINDGGLIAKARADIRASLREPASGDFMNFRSYSLANGEKAVCADVNSRNGFGGMTGFQKMVAIYEVNGRHIVFEGGPAASECAGLANGVSMRI